MRKRKILVSLLMGVWLVGPVGLGGAGLALADDAGRSPVPTESAVPTASPDPTASPTPRPTTEPQPTTTPADPTPAATATPTPTPAASGSFGQTGSEHSGDAAQPSRGADPATVGPDGCTGTIPDWVFNTSSKTWVASDAGSFSCDKASGYWLSPKYYYDKRVGWYEIMPADQPKPDYMISAPNVIHTALGDLVVGSKDYEVAKSMGLLGGNDGIVISGTGSDSNNAASVNNSNQNWIDLTSLVNVINTLQSNATSGNVAAGSNTQVGDGITGAANVIANLINLLASAWSWSSGDLSFFMQNFVGNHNGDLTLSPTQTTNGGGGQLGGSATTNNTGPNSNNIAGVNNSSTLDVNAKNTGNIVNNVDLNAQSGNASANANTLAGNVRSGDATAEVNIINLINSFINSGSSFFGILNIFGNFNGDILFPNGFLNGLIPSSATTGTAVGSVSNTGPGSNNQASVNNNAQTTINNTASNNAYNNIQTAAASGAASASSNTSAGNLSTGAATTQQGLFNLANSSIFGDNAVLVIVNVLGHWVGKIMSLPGGSTESALLTGNAQVGSNNTGPDSANQTSVNNSAKANITQQSVGTISNNVKVNAQSGNADATNNTKVGDVSTGNAKAASSVANIFNSVLNVKHWFGVLVINVFGDWLGDVNHDSAAGNAPASAQAGGGNGSGGGVSAGVTSALAGTPRVGLLALVPGVGAGSSGSNGSISAGGVNGQDSGASVSGNNAKMLTAAASGSGGGTAGGVPTGRDMSILFILSAGVMMVAGVMAALEKRLKNR